MSPYRRPAIALLSLLAACGPLPHPFESEQSNALLADVRAMAPVKVLPLAELPGLDKEVAQALQNEEITASVEDGGPGALTLQGHVEDGAVLWHIADAAGKTVADSRQPLPPGKPDALARVTLARQSAAALSRALRGEGSGLSDLEARPHVALRRIKTPPTIDADSLTLTMSRALARQGIAISDDKPVMVVEGALRVLPGPKGGQDVVEVDWRVSDATGKELGMVSQGGPVDHGLVIGNLGATGRDITNAGAEGVAEVIRQRKPAP
ncbi:MAG TPA: hypothetical protein VK558_11115 [Patescibacteria group bacterium]|nr:hypothetical protein [Patescibacteria group bacterium]